MKKYGRTFHLPWSPGATSDDKIMASVDDLRKEFEIVITEKMDGENTTIHRTGVHARSVDSAYHPSRDWMRAFAANVQYKLGDNERIVGEYLYARHSVAYDNLSSYFYGFAWIVDGVIMAVEDTMVRFAELGIIHVPILYIGHYSDKVITDITAKLDTKKQEGYVIRSADAFIEDEMNRYMGKYVRKGHVQTDTHWMHSEIVPNVICR